MGGPTTQYAVGEDGVAVITLVHPPVNALHPEGMLLPGMRPTPIISGSGIDVPILRSSQC